jgi:hypothetical protein
MWRAHTRVVFWGVAATLFAGLLSASCQDPTQLTLVVTAEPQCAISSTALYVGSGSDEAYAKSQSGSPEALTSHCVGGDIGTLVVTPGQMTGAVVVIGAVGKSATDCVDGHYDGCIIARRSFSFVRHTPLRIPIELDVDCENVPCDSTSTCVHGHCKSAVVDCSSGTCIDKADGGDVLVDGGPMFYPDGATVPMDSGMMTGTDGSMMLGDSGESDDGSALADAAVDGSDSGIVSTTADSGTDAGNMGFDAGNPNAMCAFDGTHLYVTGCGPNDLACNYPLGCCATPAAGQLGCNGGDQCAVGTPVGCCDNADCPTGQTCCGPPGIILRTPTAFPVGGPDVKLCAGGPLVAGGAPGHCQ